MSDSSPQQTTKVVGALALWFGAIGGAVAWAIHLAAAWGITETTCLAGHASIEDIPLRQVVTLAVVIPGAVAIAALAISFRVWRQTAPDRTPDGRRVGRARLLARVGFAANLLFVAIIVFDGVALMVFPPCLI
jgi:hypothetical protein